MGLGNRARHTVAVSTNLGLNIRRRRNGSVAGNDRERPARSTRRSARPEPQGPRRIVSRPGMTLRHSWPNE